MVAEFFILPNHLESIRPMFYGFQDLPPDAGSDAHIREMFLIHYIFCGKGTFFQDGAAHCLSEDDCFIIRPGEVISYRSDAEDPWSYVWLGFSCSNPALFSSTVVHQPILRGLFQQIRDLNGDPAQLGKLYSLTHEIVWLLTAETSSFRPEDYAAYAKIWMDTNYNIRLRLQDIADTLHIGQNYLCRCFKHKYEISPKEYLTELRLSKAKAFLGNGFSVSLAATMAGFSDLPNFSKQFKQVFGVSPSRFAGK